MHRVRMLIHYGVTPYLVFDGDYLPSKAITEVDRAEKRAESRRIGLELYRMGKVSQAHLELQKAVDVTPEMAKQFIEELKRHKIQYVVAPYEADAQLVYLERKGLIHGIISEDSDLLVFGARRLFTKLDQYGECFEINRKDFTACKDISLVGWSDTEFRQMAILSGCDYLANINKMGLRTAYRLVRKYKDVEKIIRVLEFDGRYKVPPGYLQNFRKAEFTFLHQRVFCPLKNKLVMTTDLGPCEEPEDFAFIGKDVANLLACGVANGDLHPMTKEPIVMALKSPTLPRSPWAVSRRQSVSTPSDLKSKSIDSFFKSRRTPLAELDPNSMTPSPSQRRLLEQHRGTWLSSRVTLPSTSSAPAASSISGHSLLGRIATNQAASSREAISAPRPHPSKRQRLCEGDEESEDNQAGVFRSRFFPPAPESSPPIKNDSRTKVKRKGADIGIWSDDSVEDVMIGMADVSDWTCDSSGGTKLAVFRDIDLPSAQVLDKLKNQKSQHSILMSTVTHISQTTPISTPDTLIPTFHGSHDTASARPQSTREVKCPTRQSTDKATCLKPADDACTVPLRSDLLQICHQDKIHKPPLLQNYSTTHSPQPQGQAIQQRSKSCEQAIELSQADTVEAGPLTQAQGQRLYVPQSPEAAGKSMAFGSEDFLIPNSEDDSDNQEPDDEWPAHTPKLKLNLSKFAFKA